MSEPVPSQPARHSLIDDAQGLFTGGFMAAFGIAILTQLGFVTGQTAGLAVLISYATGWQFGLVFFAVNLPFYWFGYKRLGLAFTIKSFIAVGLLSVLTLFMPGWVRFESLNPIVGAILYGMITGWALLALFRHGASLGGIGILALYLQDRTGFPRRLHPADLRHHAVLSGANAARTDDRRPVGARLRGAEHGARHQPQARPLRRDLMRRRGEIAPRPKLFG